jgi:hypothetical protein
MLLCHQATEAHSLCVAGRLRILRFTIQQRCCIRPCRLCMRTPGVHGTIGGRPAQPAASHCCAAMRPACCCLLLLLLLLHALAAV